MPGVHHQANRHDQGRNFGIHAFPKEFERNIWEELDRRFYIILIASLAVIYGFIIYLSHIQFSQEQVEQAIKKTYLKKIYEAELVAEVPAVKKAPSTEGSGVVETPVVEQPKPEQPDVRAKKDRGKRVEGRGASASQRALRRRRAEQVRRSQRNVIASKVAGGGVLGVLTASKGQGVGAAEAGALSNEVGGGGVSDLDKLLSGVSSLQNASSEQRHSRLGARTVGNRAGSQKGVGIDDIVTGGVGETGDYSIARQGDFSLKIGKGRVTGHAAKSTARSADAIEALINKHQDAIVDCYKRVARLNPNLKGSITVQFTIEPNGRVSAVRVLQSTLNNTKVESCISRRIRAWRFTPIDPKEGRAIFRQKFVFTT